MLDAVDEGAHLFCRNELNLGEDIVGATLRSEVIWPHRAAAEQVGSTFVGQVRRGAGEREREREN